MDNRYFLLGETVPIMVTHSENGHKVGAYVPRSECRELVCKVTYLSKIERSYEVEEIDKTAFNTHCREYWEKRGVPK